MCGFWRPMIWEQLTKVLWLRDSDAIAAKLLVGLMSHSSVLTDYSQARRPGKKGWQRPQHLVQYGWIFRVTALTPTVSHTPHSLIYHEKGPHGGINTTTTEPLGFCRAGPHSYVAPVQLDFYLNPDTNGRQCQSLGFLVAIGRPGNLIQGTFQVQSMHL